MRTSTRFRSADLVRTVTSVPGVLGIEPGIATTLRTLDSRVRGDESDAARFGVVVDDEARTVTIEVGVDGSLPVRQVVRDVQEAVLRDLGVSGAGGLGPEVSGRGSSPTGIEAADSGARAQHDGGAGGGENGDGGAGASSKACAPSRAGGGGVPVVTVRTQSLSR